MTENKQFEGAGSATSDSRRKTRFWHWMRVVVSFMSGGFVFPHALTEEDETDTAGHGAPKDVSAKDP